MNGPALLSAAAGTPALSLDLTSILQFGLLGLIFLCLVFRKFVVPEWVLKDTEDRAAEERALLAQRIDDYKLQLEKLQSVFQEQMIPALTRATEVNAKYNEEMQKARFRTRPDPGSDPRGPHV